MDQYQQHTYGPQQHQQQGACGQQQQYQHGYRHGYQARSRSETSGAAVLVLALIGIFAFWPLCIVAWVLGNRERDRAGSEGREMDDMTKAGRIIGMVGTLLPLVILVVVVPIFLLIMFGIIAIGAAAVSSASTPPSPPVNVDRQVEVSPEFEPAFPIPVEAELRRESRVQKLQPSATGTTAEAVPIEAPTQTAPIRGAEQQPESDGGSKSATGEASSENDDSDDEPAGGNDAETSDADAEAGDIDAQTNLDTTPGPHWAA